MRRAIVTVNAAIRLNPIRSLHLQAMSGSNYWQIPLSCLFGLVIVVVREVERFWCLLHEASVTGPNIVDVAEAMRIEMMSDNH